MINIYNISQNRAVIFIIRGKVTTCIFISQFVALVFVKVISGFLFSCWLYSHLGNVYSDCGILSVVTNYSF